MRPILNRKAGSVAKVEIRKTADRYQLYVNGQPFYIKGAGLEFGSQEKLALHGGNSFRTWRTENGQDSGRQVLDRALKNGLFVTMGLESRANGTDSTTTTRLRSPNSWPR